MVRTVDVEHYPFTILENEKVIKEGFRHQVDLLAANLPVAPIRRNRIAKFIEVHFNLAESHFAFEEQSRIRGFKFADLFYHRKEHAVFQAGYDAITTIRALLERGDALSSQLSLEGIIAAPIAAVNHDTGYVVVDRVPKSYSSRASVHVNASQAVVQQSLQRIDAPPFLDVAKISRLAVVGIHSTNFPFDDNRIAESRQMVHNLPKAEWKEAHIVRLAVQLADLGGQVARVDYVDLLKDLREEINRSNPGMGEKIIGEDYQMAIKCRGFINFCVEKGMVGRTAKAFFGFSDHVFGREWAKHGTINLPKTTLALSN